MWLLLSLHSTISCGYFCLCITLYHVVTFVLAQHYTMWLLLSLHDTIPCGYFCLCTTLYHVVTFVFAQHYSMWLLLSLHNTIPCGYFYNLPNLMIQINSLDNSNKSLHSFFKPTVPVTSTVHTDWTPTHMICDGLN